MNVDLKNLKLEILVLFANSYDMKDEFGNRVAGCSVHYMFWGEAGSNLISQSVDDLSKPVGIQRAKCSLDIGKRQNVMIAPAIYEGDFEMTVGSDGRPVPKLLDLHYKCNVEMKEKVVPGLVVPGMVLKESSK